MNTKLIDSVIKTLEELNDIEMGQGEVEEECVRISWSTPELYAEISVYSDGSRNWLWVNRETGELGGNRESEQGPLPEELLKVLSPFQTRNSRSHEFISLLKSELKIDV